MMTPNRYSLVFGIFLHTSFSHRFLFRSLSEDQRLKCLHKQDWFFFCTVVFLQCSISFLLSLLDMIKKTFCLYKSDPQNLNLYITYDEKIDLIVMWHDWYRDLNQATSFPF